MRATEKKSREKEEALRRETNRDKYQHRREAVLYLSAFFSVSATDRLPPSVSPPLPLSDIVKVGCFGAELREEKRREGKIDKV